jgi:hypothetical protein
MNNKNIAILFAGRVKAYKPGSYISYKKYIEQPLLDKGYTPYVFLSHNDRNTDIDLEDFKKSYDVKGFENTRFDDIDKYWHLPLQHSTKPHHAYPMFFHIYRAFLLSEKYSVENNITFDAVIYMRADEEFSEPLELNIDTLAENTVYIPTGNDHTGVNDQFAYGRTESMKKYIVFPNILELWEKYNMPFHPETYVMYNLIYQKLNYIRFPFNYVLQNARHQ